MQAVAVVQRRPYALLLGANQRCAFLQLSCCTEGKERVFGLIAAAQTLFLRFSQP